MSEDNSVAGFFNRWRGVISALSLLIALLALLGLGNFFYNEVWLNKELVYTILPNYDLGNQYFGGVIIENSGRTHLSSVQIIITDLDSPIAALNMPGAHEPVTIIDGGIGNNNVTLQMQRLSQSASVPIYFLAEGEIVISSDKIFVSSNEVTGISSDESSNIVPSAILGIVFGGILTFVISFIQDARTKFREPKSEAPSHRRIKTSKGTAIMPDESSDGVIAGIAAGFSTEEIAAYSNLGENMIHTIQRTLRGIAEVENDEEYTEWLIEQIRSPLVKDNFNL